MLSNFGYDLDNGYGLEIVLIIAVPVVLLMAAGIFVAKSQGANKESGKRLKGLAFLLLLVAIGIFISWL